MGNTLGKFSFPQLFKYAHNFLYIVHGHKRSVVSITGPIMHEEPKIK